MAGLVAVMGAVTAGAAEARGGHHGFHGRLGERGASIKHSLGGTTRQHCGPSTAPVGNATVAAWECHLWVPAWAQADSEGHLEYWIEV